jgi:uncharacterized protein
MERRYNVQPAVLEKRDSDAPVIVGYGSVFFRDGDPSTEYVLWDDPYSRAVERIMPGAFDRALSRPDDVRALFNHDPNQVLGRTSAGTMRITTDAKGLRYEIDPGDTQVSRDVQEHLRRGDVTGSSFSFAIPPGGDRWTRTTDPDGKAQEVREVLDVQLYDVGPVTFPAYSGSTAATRDAGDVADARAAHESFMTAQRGRMAEVAAAEVEIAERAIFR